MTFLAILAGIGAIFNYYAVTAGIYSLFLAIFLQTLLLLLAIIAGIGFRGQRSCRSYDGGWYKVATVRFALIMISLLGNLSIFIVFILNQLGYLSVF